MSFTLRTVTQRAGGGEIVRRKVLESDSISIGRGTDCDLQLPDLAVALRHAQMTRTGPGRVSIEAAAGQSFEAQDGFTSRASLEVSRKPRVIFGGHALTLSPGENSNDIAVTVERIEAAGALPGDETRTFSPGATGFSKRAMAWVFGSLVVALCLAWPITAFYTQQNARIHADTQWSSGPLSRSHAFLEKDCQACHQQAFVAIRDDACLTCHKAGRSAVDQGAVFARVKGKGAPDSPHLVGGHADFTRLMRATPLPADFGGKVEAVFRRLFNHPDTRCASCHREHLDAGGQKMAPTASPQAMKPVRDKPTLVTSQDCAGCHGGLKARLSDTTLRDTPDWTRHPDFRPLVMVQPGGPTPRFERVSIGPGVFERSGLKFGHRIHLSAVGGVARMGQQTGATRTPEGGLDCAACHHADASGSGFRPVDMPRDCGSCHSLAFARTSSGLKLLPHGHPDQVVATLKAFYGAGGPYASAPAPWSRRLPGAAAEARTETRRSGSYGGAAAVASGVRSAFSSGGACYDCHTVLAPRGADSLAYGIAPVSLTSRYLPRGAFDHSIRAHRQDSAGQARCADCHKAATSDRAEDVLMPKIAQCAACHGKSPAQSHEAAASDCGECHSYHAPTRPERTPRPEDRVAAMPARGDRRGS